MGGGLWFVVCCWRGGEGVVGFMVVDGGLAGGDCDSLLFLLFGGDRKGMVKDGVHWGVL